MATPLRDRRMGGDDGYALVSVIGLGMAILMSVGAVSAYALQAMDSAGSTQGFHASIQAAQAGVDQFVSKLNNASTPAEITAAINAGAGWQAVPGSQDGSGTTCTSVSGGSLPPNCPKFKYTVTPSATGYEITSTGYSRGETRSVRVALRQRGFTDYLYFSESEAGDPNDRFLYPNIPLLGMNGAPANCGNKSWAEGAAAARPVGCKVPTWRPGDTTDGSRVHTRDKFTAVGNPSFNSRVTAAVPSCATAPSTCFTGGTPTYSQGSPSYADDLSMPSAAALLADISAAATATGCTYYGPTRIKFLEGADAGKMQVWSPFSPYFMSAADVTRCMGAQPTNLLGLSLDIKVNGSNLGIINNLLGGLSNLVLGLTCVTLGLGCPNTVNLSLTNILAGNLLGDLAGALPLYSPPKIAIPSAMYVKTATTAPPGLVPAAQCLLGSAAGLGLHSGDIQAALNNGLLSPSDCREGKLYISGKLKGKTTIGTEGSITILTDLTYTDRNTDRLGLVAQGPVEVYNSLQCLLSLGTCLSLNSLTDLLPSVLSLLANLNPSRLQLTNVLNSLQVDRPITVEAAIVTNSRFGVQLPLLSPTLNLGLVNQLIGLNIDPPKLTLRGSVAQRYRGVFAADLLGLQASLGLLGATLDLASLNVDMGYKVDLQYDPKLRTDPPLYMPKPGVARWDQVSFAEVSAA